MPLLSQRLTESGHRLYWIYREVTDGCELTPAEFIDLLCNAYGLKDECRSCGRVRNLCSGGFCINCTAGTISTT